MQHKLGNYKTKQTKTESAAVEMDYLRGRCRASTLDDIRIREQMEEREDTIEEKDSDVRSHEKNERHQTAKMSVEEVESHERRNYVVFAEVRPQTYDSYRA